MKNILIALLVVAVVLLTLGAVNHSTNVDLHLVLGTWHHASLLWPFVCAAFLVLVSGLLAAGSTGMRAGRTRQKLDNELDETYRRLRAAEARPAAVPATGAVKATGEPPAAPASADAAQPADAVTPPATNAGVDGTATAAPPEAPPAADAGTSPPEAPPDADAGTTATDGPPADGPT